MPRALPVVALALLTAAATVPMAAPLQNDARSEGDAPDDPSAALDLEQPGTYPGNLTPPDDADWYRLGGTGASCLEAEVGGAAVSEAVLADGAGLARDVNQTLLPHDDLGLGLASQNPDALFLGLTPREAPSGDDLGTGAYEFDVERAPVSGTSSDPGSGSDVPGDRNGTLPRVPDACFRGVLNDAENGSASEADADAYNFTGHPGDDLALSLASVHDNGATTYLNLTSPTGETVLTIRDSGLASTTLPMYGNWTVSLETPSTSVEVLYGVGFSHDFRDPREDEDDDDDDGDDGDDSSCRPGCLPTMLP